MTKFTGAQLDAIGARDKATVVSAAAGSGKTTVLIERIIRMIISGECSVDELLVVTFTRAATAEIRTRLSTEITKALKADSSNDTLAKQQMLVPSADIYTIDAFCGSLVRENFEALNISPDFKSIDDTLRSLYINEALTKTLDKYYNEESPEFDTLNALFKGNWHSISLEEVVKDIYEKCQGHTDPEKTLEESISYYTYDCPTEESPAVREAVKSFLDYLDYALSGIKLGIDLCAAGGESAAKLYGTLTNDYQFLTECIPLIEKYDFDALAEKSGEYKFVGWSRPKDENLASSAELAFAKNCRDSISGYFKRGRETLLEYFVSDAKGIEKDRKIQLPALKALVKIVKDFESEYQRIKVERNAFDFSDVEHLAYSLLADKDGSKTQLARDISKKYKQILIDEYQDTDELQDEIFKLISDDEKNLFMVGDIKQSIYAFRNAMPELFLNKKETYEGSLTLGDNFRSSFGIVNYVNFVFSQLMTKECGDIDYRNEDEQLIYGKDEEKDYHRTDVELHLFSKGKLMTEAEFIANYISDAMKSDSNLSYSDFVILMRTAKGKSAVIANALSEKNIPVVFESDAKFFETADTKIVLSLLHVIDNPLQDIHMLAVLMSPVFGLSADKIADIRSREGNRDKHLYTNLLSCENEDEVIKNICDTIRLYRQLSVSMPVGELIRKIYSDTLLPDIVATMPNGTSRKANLLLLQDYADTYEQNNELGISSFVYYLDTIVENDMKLKNASLNSGTTDAVRITTIHKSKGLQFNICFVPDLGASFKDGKNTIEYGQGVKIGIKSCNTATGDIYDSFISTQIHRECLRAYRSEELRVLYVAMTRAKNKLILSGVPSDTGIKRAVKSSLLNDDGYINPQSLSDARSLLEFLLSATVHHTYAGELRRRFAELEKADESSFEILNSETPILFKIHDPAVSENISVSETDPLIGKIDSKRLKELTERMNYEYPYLALSTVPTKRSASATEAAGFDTRYFASAEPEFLRGDKLTPAQKGTCLHRFMQFADFDEAKTDAAAEIQRLYAKGYFTEAEAAAIDVKKVEAFFRSDMFTRMERSEKVWREHKFAVLVPAVRFNPSLKGEMAEETVLIQGIADCVFVEDGKLVILDYKTDRSKVEQDFIERHKAQLMTYAEALTDALAMPVKEAYVYAFSLDKEIKVI